MRIDPIGGSFEFFSIEDFPFFFVDVKKLFTALTVHSFSHNRTLIILWRSVLGGVKTFFSFLLLLCICNTGFKEMNSASLLKLCSFPPQNPHLLVFSSPTILASYAKATYVPRFGRTLGRARCEFDVKGNGALSSDTDLRAIERQKALEAAMNDINNSFGKGSVTRLGSMGGALVETFPSGCLTLDFALGGGLPKGRIVEIFGPESSGKTTLALHAIAEVQKLGGNAMLVDAEHVFDPAYSRALGVNIENLIVCQPDNGEMALEIADRMCRSGAIDLICVDSVSALTPRAEIEGEIGMQQIGLQARLMSQALRKMSGNASKAGCTLIFLNQIRYKIGVFYGNPEVTSGGIALKFFASLRLEIRPIGKIKSGDEDIGVRVRVRVQKSKVSRPYKQAEFEIIFGEGVGKLGCVLDCAETMDVVAKKGSWYSYGDQRLGQGRDKALQFLRENPLIFTDIEKAVKAVMTEGSKHMSFIAYGESPNFDDEIKHGER
ncbi:DNA repair protein recA homolog 1, chloroplastic [Dendrobium catenatum]|nr:DNA repair protein recA homolog 1, chloroplastic [Dendrobium catenatum]